MGTLVEPCLLFLRNIKSNTLQWAAQRPVLALVIVIIITGSILPFISALSLLPVVAIFNIGHFLESKGIFTIFSAIFGQGMFLVVVLCILFTVSFLTVTSANLFHSYRSKRKN